MKWWLFLLACLGVLVVACTPSCPETCDDGNSCTNDFCSGMTNFECQHEEKKQCEGNSICEWGEYGTSDCPNCDDGDPNTRDTLNYETLECLNQEHCNDECTTSTCVGSDYHECGQGSSYCMEKKFQGPTAGKCGVECVRNSDCPSSSYSCLDNMCIDEFEAVSVAQDYVRSQLKSPSTAKFSWDVDVTKSGSTFLVLSYVDSQNGFGAMVRTYYAIEVEYRGVDVGGNARWAVVDATFE